MFTGNNSASPFTPAPNPQKRNVSDATITPDRHPGSSLNSVSVSAETRAFKAPRFPNGSPSVRAGGYNLFESGSSSNFHFQGVELNSDSLWPMIHFLCDNLTNVLDYAYNNNLVEGVDIKTLLVWRIRNLFSDLNPENRPFADVITLGAPWEGHPYTSTTVETLNTSFIPHTSSQLSAASSSSFSVDFPSSVSVPSHSTATPSEIARFANAVAASSFNTEGASSASLVNTEELGAAPVNTIRARLNDNEVADSSQNDDENTGSVENVDAVMNFKDDARDNFIRERAEDFLLLTPLCDPFMTTPAELLPPLGVDPVFTPLSSGKLTKIEGLAQQAAHLAIQYSDLSDKIVALTGYISDGQFPPHMIPSMHKNYGHLIRQTDIETARNIQFSTALETCRGYIRVAHAKALDVRVAYYRLYPDYLLQLKRETSIAIKGLPTTNLARDRAITHDWCHDISSPTYTTFLDNFEKVFKSKIVSRFEAHLRKEEKKEKFIEKQKTSALTSNRRNSNSGPSNKDFQYARTTQNAQPQNVRRVASFDAKNNGDVIKHIKGNPTGGASSKNAPAPGKSAMVPPNKRTAPDAQNLKQNTGNKNRDNNPNKKNQNGGNSNGRNANWKGKNKQ